MPVQCIIEHPAVLAMRAQTLGAFMRLVLHYWATECREMCETDREWAMISRGGEKLWKNHGAELRVVFAEIQPVLQRYHTLRVNQHTHMKDLSLRAVGKRKSGTLTDRREALAAARRELPRAVPVSGASPVPVVSDDGRRRRVG